MNIVLIGCGNVGKALTKLLLERDHGINLSYIVTRSGAVSFSGSLEYMDNLKYHPCFKENMGLGDILINNPNIDLVVELTTTDIQTGRPALDYIELALKAGKHVVTGNKGPIIHRYKSLKALADKHGVQLGIGCTTGGALPAINTGIYGLAGCQVLSVEGVLNGTSNYILEEMETSRLDYKCALAAAQAQGIAEANPSYDTQGYDTAAKLLILTNILFNESKAIDDIQIKGIESVTQEDITFASGKNKKIKLVGCSQYINGQLKMSVRPVVISVSSPLYTISGSNKGVLFQTDLLGDIFVSGGKSSPQSAAAAIIRDIINIKNGRAY